MAAHAIKHAVERAGVDKDYVEDSYLGNCAHGAPNIGRQAALLAGLPKTTAGVSINRFCSSGLQSIAMAANQIASGQTHVAMAGGVDSISMRTRQEPGKAKQNKRLVEEKPAIFMAMGNTAEVVARRYQVTREAQDVYALQSQQRYAAAADKGYIREEIVPMKVTMNQVDKKTGAEKLVEVVVDRDECNRPDTTLEGLAKLPPAFEEDGSVTAGNASQLSDGASMTLLMSGERAGQLGLKPMGDLSRLHGRGLRTRRDGHRAGLLGAAAAEDARSEDEDIDLWDSTRRSPHSAFYCRDALGIDNENLQRQRRLDRDRPSVRHDRVAPRPASLLRELKPPQNEIWRRHDVYRRRPGGVGTVRNLQLRLPRPGIGRHQETSSAAGNRRAA